MTASICRSSIRLDDNDAATTDKEEDMIRAGSEGRTRIRSKRNSNHVLGQKNAHHHYSHNQRQQQSLPEQQQQQQQSADQPSSSSTVAEFFNPKLRHELEKKDAEYLKRTGTKGAASDSWVSIVCF